MCSDNQPFEGSWGWFIVVCSIINHAFTVGLMMSLSVLYVSWLDEFGAGKGVTSWILSVGVACMFGLCPIPANLATRFGFRTVGFVGGILACAGLTVSAFARSITDLIVSIGFLTGIGCCFCYLPGVAMVALYFEKRRSLAMGIATAGTGIGAFGLAPLLNYLEQSYGWRGALLVLGALSLHMCVTGMMMRPSDGVRQGEEVERDGDTKLSRAKREENSTFTNSETDVSHMYDENFSMVSKDNTASPVIGRKSQLQTREIEIPGGTYFDDVGKSSNTCSDLGRLLSSNGEKVNEKPETKRGVGQCTGRSQCNIGTPHSYIKILDGTRRFVSLDDIRRKQGKTNHHFVSLQSLNSRTNVNKRTENSVLRNIRNIDIHLLASICHLLEKTEHNENWAPLLSTDIDGDLQTNMENSRDKKSFISRFLSSRTLRVNIEMLKEKSFLAFAFSNFLNNLAFMACIVHLVDRAVVHGIDKSVSAMIISANGLGNIFGRLFFGWLAHRLSSNHLLMYISTLVICGLGTVASPLCGQIAILHGVFAVFFGCMTGVYVMLAPLVTVSLMGVSRVATAYGLVLCFMGPATVLGAPFAGWMFDWSKTYVLPYVVNGIFLLTSGVMLVPLLRRTKETQSPAFQVTASFEKKTTRPTQSEA